MSDSSLEKQNILLSAYCPFPRHTFQPLFETANCCPQIPTRDSKNSKLIGNGKYGQVESANYKGETVAVKFFSSEANKDKPVALIELIFCMTLNHENVVRLIAAGPSPKHREVLYLIFEYAPFASMDNFLDPRANYNCITAKIVYGLSHVFNWMTQCMRALFYMHNFDPSVIHRDIKPANMLLFNKGSLLKLCDFGISCAINDSKTLTQEMGTIKYISPENTAEYGNKVKVPLEIQHTCDVYAWSLCFWELLMRQIAFKDYSRFQMQNVYIKGERPEPIDELHPLIGNLLTMAWHEDPHQRPTSTVVCNFMNELMDSLWPGGGLADRFPLDTPLEDFNELPCNPINDTNEELSHKRNRMNSVVEEQETKLREEFPIMPPLEETSKIHGTSLTIFNDHVQLFNRTLLSKLCELEEITQVVTMEIQLKKVYSEKFRDKPDAADLLEKQWQLIDRYIELNVQDDNLQDSVS